MEKKKKLSLPVQIFIALVLGIVVGLMFYFTGAAGFTTSYITVSYTHLRAHET